MSASRCSTVLLVFFALTVSATAQAAKPSLSVAATLGKLPLYFVENRGVYPDDVKYYIQGADKTLFFTDDGVTLALRGEQRGWTVKLDFVDANENARPEGRDHQAAVISYFKGPEKDWKTGLPTFAEIIYRDLWPGIDLVYRGTVNRLKYEFQVAPGADPKKIRLRYRGIENLEHTPEGALRVDTPEGGFEDAPPMAWQNVDGGRVPVDIAYALGEDGGFGFALGDYDRTRSLVLDPAVLVYCGYIGGSAADAGNAIAVDAAGNVYVAGSTSSTESSFPVTVGPDLTYNGGRHADAFVAKVNPQGTALLYCGYIGGSDHFGESAEGIAVDAAGNAYVTGHTDSSEASFPVKVGPGLTHNAYFDAFVAKVNAKGTALVYCGYIGGNDTDIGNAIAVDAAGNAYVAGSTASTETSFPVKVGPDLTYNTGSGFDAFVAKVNAQGISLGYCGYIGGSKPTTGQGIAVDAVGNAYVTGFTMSSEATFPVKVGPDLTFSGGRIVPTDAYVAKVDAQGAALDYCGYIGGGENDWGYAIAVDAVGSAYVTGKTESTELTFPIKIGPDLTHNGSVDAFVAKVDAQGMALRYCGYIGGDRGDQGLAIAVDASGNAYVTGTTGSTEQTFPVRVGPDLTYNGSFTDAFVAKVNTAGVGLLCCGYIGGDRDDRGNAIALDAAGNAYVTGEAVSTEQTFPVKAGPDLTYNGGSANLGDAFVAKVALTLLEGSGSFRPGTAANLTLTASDDVGLVYQVGSSLGIGPIRIGSRKLGLSPDNLLVVSVNGWWASIFSGYQGAIGANGQANAAINIPKFPLLVGNTIHTAFVTVSGSAPQGIKSISNMYSFTIVP